MSAGDPLFGQQTKLSVRPLLSPEAIRRLIATAPVVYGYRVRNEDGAICYDCSIAELRGKSTDDVRAITQDDALGRLLICRSCGFTLGDVTERVFANRLLRVQLEYLGQSR